MLEELRKGFYRGLNQNVCKLDIFSKSQNTKKSINDPHHLRYENKRILNTGCIKINF